MILEIEFYKGDVMLAGKRLDKHSLRELLNRAEQICGASGDLAETLCSAYGFERIITNVLPDWRYDRDTGELYALKGNLK